ncbi:MAG: hypothetical protein M1399_00155 [Actinobacteria bacterium]|nr:hypothetical protein [Actinomycetota bacterium]MCL5446456.1 hypothetical protein [Actinomycetota bacterium]
MGEVILQSMRPDLVVSSAGTLAIEGQPLSTRTRNALEHIEMRVPFHHRSRELTSQDVDSADLVVAMAREHVRYVRRHYPAAAPKTAALKWLVEELPEGPEPLNQRVDQLMVERVDLEEMQDVIDPADPVGITMRSDVNRIEVEMRAYVECALEIRDLVTKLESRL